MSARVQPRPLRSGLRVGEVAQEALAEHFESVACHAGVARLRAITLGPKRMARSHLIFPVAIEALVEFWRLLRVPEHDERLVPRGCDATHRHLGACCQSAPSMHISGCLTGGVVLRIKNGAHVLARTGGELRVGRGNREFAARKRLTARIGPFGAAAVARPLEVWNDDRTFPLTPCG
eukprot:scaffold130974_cov21-Tisochrysis_lutea.AAC.3